MTLQNTNAYGNKNFPVECFKYFYLSWSKFHIYKLQGPKKSFPEQAEVESTRASAACCFRAVSWDSLSCAYPGFLPTYLSWTFLLAFYPCCIDTYYVCFLGKKVWWRPFSGQTQFGCYESQCPRTDLNKRFLAKPMITTWWKRTL